MKKVRISGGVIFQARTVTIRFQATFNNLEHPMNLFEEQIQTLITTVHNSLHRKGILALLLILFVEKLFKPISQFSFQVRIFMIITRNILQTQIRSIWCQCFVIFIKSAPSCQFKFHCAATTDCPTVGIIRIYMKCSIHQWLFVAYYSQNLHCTPVFVIGQLLLWSYCTGFLSLQHQYAFGQLTSTGIPLFIHIAL